MVLESKIAVSNTDRVDEGSPNSFGFGAKVTILYLGWGRCRQYKAHFSIVLVSLGAAVANVKLAG